VNKIDFPTNVELPMRGGGSAVLTEFFDGMWWGRARHFDGSGWRASSWQASGAISSDPMENNSYDIYWTPPKRTVWLVWRDGFGVPAAYLDETNALELVRELGGLIQEIERP